MFIHMVVSSLISNRVQIPYFFLFRFDDRELPSPPGSDRAPPVPPHPSEEDSLPPPPASDYVNYQINGGRPPLDSQQSRTRY